MIQFNLLPDVKLQFVKAQRLKRLMTLGAIALSVVSLVILGFVVFTAKFVQTKSLNDLNRDIAAASDELKSVKDLNKILTVQNQLNTVNGLHDDKVVASRMFAFANQLTPATASISNLAVDFAAKTITVSGEAPSLDVVNIYTDTLKATTYGSGDTQKNAFSNVVLTSFSRDKSKATYTVTLNYDDVIFQNDQDIKLTVPAGTTADPANLFQATEAN